MAAADEAYDPRLTPAARRYIATRTSGDSRRDAIDAALMDSMEFRARYGPGFDAVEAKIDAILAALQSQPVVGGGPLTRTAQWMEATPFRRATTVVGLIAAVAAALTEVLDAIARLLGAS